MKLINNCLLNAFHVPGIVGNLEHKGWSKTPSLSPRGTQTSVGWDTKEGQIIYSKWLLLGIPELVKIHKNDWNNIKYAKHICQENVKSFLQSHLFYLTNTYKALTKDSHCSKCSPNIKSFNTNNIPNEEGTIIIPLL